MSCRKQDCELAAGYRMLPRLRDDYPRMAAIIVPSVAEEVHVSRAVVR